MKIMTWFWPGRLYTAENVNVWARMMRAGLTIPHTLACVTDHPEGIDEDIEIIPTPTEFLDFRPRWPRVPLPECYRRLSLYSPIAAKLFGAERFVSMDLDVLVLDNLDSLFDHNLPFRISKGSCSTGHYGGSMVQMDAGARPEVYRGFSIATAEQAARVRSGSDRSWLNWILPPGDPIWGPEHGVMHYIPAAAIGGHKFAPAGKLMFFSGTRKPWFLDGWPRRLWEIYRG